MRINTPNDPDFDRCEPDDEQGATCTNVFDQQIERFGFAPNGSQLTALYHNPTDPHAQRLSAQNTLAGRNPLGPGVGRLGGPRLEVLDRHRERAGRDPRHRHPLGQGLAAQEGRAATAVSCRSRSNGASTCAQYDCNSDGAFNVDDYANDPRVSATSGTDDEPGADSPPGRAAT